MATNKKVAEWMRTIGSKGGRNGKGNAKRRGDADYYKGLASKRKDRQVTVTTNLQKETV